MAQMLWKPSEESIRKTNMYRFMQFINARYSQKLDDYPTLYRWSVDHIPEFWAAMWEFSNIIHSAPYRDVVDDLTFCATGTSARP
jgi:acetoacetyl-CoA synthetase